MYHALGTPLVHDFKTIIQMNASTNNPLTTQEVEMAEKIFGPDINS
jgi:hypothetical protein